MRAFLKGRNIIGEDICITSQLYAPCCSIAVINSMWGERERERDFYVNGKTCLPFLGHKTAIRSYYQWCMSYWCSFVLETKCVLFFPPCWLSTGGPSNKRERERENFSASMHTYIDQKKLYCVFMWFNILGCHIFCALLIPRNMDI